METVVFTAEWQMKPDYTDMQKGIRHYHREILTISIHVPRTFLFFENLCYTTCSILTYVYGKNFPFVIQHSFLNLSYKTFQANRTTNC